MRKLCAIAMALSGCIAGCGNIDQSDDFDRSNEAQASPVTVAPCRRLRAYTDEVITTNTNICSGVYPGVRLTISGQNLTVVGEGFLPVSLDGGSLELRNLQSSSVSRIWIANSSGVSRGAFGVIKPVVSLHNSSNNNIDVGAVCNKSDKLCVGLVLDSPTNNSNRISVIAMNGYTGVYVISGQKNYITYNVSGVGNKGSNGQPICVVDQTRTNNLKGKCAGL